MSWLRSSAEQRVPNKSGESRHTDQQHQRQHDFAEALLLDLVQQKLAGIGARDRDDEKQRDEPVGFSREKTAAQINNHPAEVHAGIARCGGRDENIFLKVESAEGETADRATGADRAGKKTLPAVIAFNGRGESFALGRSRKKALNAMRKSPRISSVYLNSSRVLSQAPRMTKSVLGIPSRSRRRHYTAVRKRTSFDVLLKTWRMLVSARTW